MTGYVALLRSVNLLGNSVLKMADLRAIAEELGLSSPRTFIASGNLLFTSDKPEEELRRMLEQRVAAHMGRPVAVLKPAQTGVTLSRPQPLNGPGDPTVPAFIQFRPAVVRAQMDECGLPNTGGSIKLVSGRTTNESGWR